jgi:predicted membrane-bound dolichyl-phosphate-mannose-protein mannosyltransferase
MESMLDHEPNGVASLKATGTGPLGPDPDRTVQRRLLWGLAIALVWRLLLAALPGGLKFDLDTFAAWGLQAADRGLASLYAPGQFCDYPPLWLMVLGGLGMLGRSFDGAHAASFVIHGVKVLAGLADLATAWLLFHLLRGRVSRRTALAASLGYAFNPATWFVSGVWGQIDGVVTLVALIGTMMILGAAPLGGMAVASLALLVKPQALFTLVLAPLAGWFRLPWRVWPMGAGIAAVLTTFAMMPFTGIGPGGIPALVQRMAGSTTTYDGSTINAFNLWTVTSLRNGTVMWGAQFSDTRLLPGLTPSWLAWLVVPVLGAVLIRSLGGIRGLSWLKGGGLLAGLAVLLAVLLGRMSHAALGLCLVAGVTGWVGTWVWKRRDEGWGPIWLGGACLVLGVFLLATRMHERYGFPAVALLTLAAAHNRGLGLHLSAFSATTFLNLGYVYLYYMAPSTFEAIPPGLRSGVIIGCVLANMALFGDLLAQLATPATHRIAPGEEAFPVRLAPRSAAVAEAWGRWDTWAAAAAGGLFFLMGLWRLGTPDEQIFDEVYHARTAQEYLRDIDPYEWTHPPLAKLAISLGIRLFGMHGFGWRLPSLVAGGLALAVFFVLARRMLGTRRPALLATLLLGLDGVFWVQSRVAMTNIHVLLFMLVASWCVWEFTRRGQERWLVGAAAALGASLATRWSSLYAGLWLAAWVAIWVIGFERPRRPVKDIVALALRTTLSWTLIPAMVYLLCYIPYYGAHAHSVQEWLTRLWELQQRMWGYHANLHASHSYACPWWQWPLMLRPTWYYFHDWKNGTISGIVCLGNPTLWWASVPALAATAVLAVRRRWTAGAFLALMGFGMWLPWAVQPRSLTFMHYMFETMPFAAIAIAALVFELGERLRLVGPTPAPEGASPEATGPVVSWFQNPHPLLLPSLYGLATVLLFAWFYPLWTGLPVVQTFYRAHIWLRTWI